MTKTNGITNEVDVDDMINSRHRRDSKKDNMDSSQKQQRRRSSRMLPVDVELNASVRDLEAPVHRSSYYSKPNQREDLSKVKSFHEGDGYLPTTKGHHTADPFAPRDGKTLVWKNVNMTLVSTSKELYR